MNAIPRIGLESLQKTDFTGQVRKLQFEPDVQGPTFKDVMGGVVSNVNETLGAPDALMRQSMTGGTVDVHDVMIANAKAELAINVTAQVATKVVQAYDRILQIQI